MDYHFSAFITDTLPRFNPCSNLKFTAYPLNCVLHPLDTKSRSLFRQSLSELWSRVVLSLPLIHIIRFPALTFFILLLIRLLESCSSRRSSTQQTYLKRSHLSVARLRFQLNGTSSRRKWSQCLRLGRGSHRVRNASCEEPLKCLLTALTHRQSNTVDITINIHDDELQSSPILKRSTLIHFSGYVRSIPFTKTLDDLLSISLAAQTLPSSSAINSH